MKKILILLFLIYPAVLEAQIFNRNVSKTGTVAATFLEIPVGASAIGMGGAFVSVAADASALYWNAAGIASMQQMEFMAQHTNWLAGTGFDYAALILPLSGIGTFGFSFTSLNMPDMKVTTVDMPQGTGEFFSAGDMAVGVSYAMSLTDRFSIGFNAKYIQQKIWHETASGFAVDFSTLFRTDLLNGLIIGAAISNFGTSMQLAGRDTRTFGRVDPTKQGSNERIPFDIEMDSWDLPLFMQLGISTNVVRTEELKWIVAVDALHPNDNYESVNVGSEISYHDMVFLRGGFNSLFLKQKEGGLSLGIGVSSGNFFGQTGIRFDYAYRNFGRLENIHVFSVDLRF
ncbi:MAG: PorV/PorQ family protein [Ignavibacteria bacterium]|nr:PorV/PorQ family protein [Ignavibacteria bacterium]MCU7521563.1 PorV/PorQ family protein [Ignavibacteria bacterium]